MGENLLKVYCTFNVQIIITFYFVLLYKKKVLSLSQQRKTVEKIIFSLARLGTNFL